MNQRLPVEYELLHFLLHEVLPGSARETVPRPADSSASSSPSYGWWYRGVRQEEGRSREKLLESLAAVGVALETAVEPGGKRMWSLVR
jgi:hypothetical protein